MNALPKLRRSSAFTIIDLLVVLLVLGSLAALLFPALNSARGKSQRIACVNNLKNIGLAFRIFATDHKDQFPQATLPEQSVPDGSIGVARLFMVLSNELSTPRLLVCPADARQPATGFPSLHISNVSYFIGLDANVMRPDAMLAGDRNLTNGAPLTNGVLLLDPSRPVGWTHEMHASQGNVVFGDGSVQQFDNARLQQRLRDFGFSTNRLLLPE